MLELIYTAAPRGLDPGRSGFVTVARTEGFPPNLLSPLENLSGYKALFPPEDPKAGANPMNCSLQRHGQGSGAWYVVSRISHAGLSYTGRSNNLAHHLVFTREELVAIPGGAAAILANDANFPKFDGQPRLLGVRRCHGCVPSESAGGGATWARLCGNGDWARVIAERFRVDHTKGVVLQFVPGVHEAKDILALVSEVVELLSPEEAVDFTFSTYCYQSTIGNPVFFRSYTEESPYLASARRMNPRGVIVLGKDNPLGEEEELILAKYQERLQREKEEEEEREAMKRANARQKKQSESYGDASAMNKRVIHEHGNDGSGAGSAPCQKASSSGDPSKVSRGREPEARHLNWYLIGLVGAAVLALAFFVAVLVLGDSSLPRETGKSTEDAESVSEDQSVDPSNVREDNTVQETPPIPSAPEESRVADESVQQVVESPSEGPVMERASYTNEEKLQFFEEFLLDSKNEILLPERFSQGGVLAFEVDGIGDKDSLPETAMEVIPAESNRCVVYSIRNDESGITACWVADPENDSGQMVLEITEGKLCVKEPAVGEISPRRENITRILLDNEVLYERNLSEELLRFLDATCKVSGGLFYDLNINRLYVRVEEVSGRLKKYCDYIRLEAKVANGSNQGPRCNEYPLELVSGDQADIVTFGEIADIAVLVSAHSRLERDLEANKKELAGIYKKGEKAREDLNNRFSYLENNVLMGYPDMEITVKGKEGKKSQKVKVELNKIANEIKGKIGELKNKLGWLENPGENLEGDFKNGCWGECLNHLLVARDRLVNADLRKGENFNFQICQIDNVVRMMTEIDQCLSQSWNQRCALKQAIHLSEVTKEENERSLGASRQLLKNKLLFYLPEESCEKILGTEASHVVEPAVLQSELLESCKVEFSLRRK